MRVDITFGNVYAMSKTPSQFIEAVGIGKMAADLNRKEGAVRVWKTRNKFPRSLWLELSRAYPSLTLETLRKMERHAKPRTDGGQDARP